MNLTEVVVRADDTRESLLQKVELATILGTVQSMFTDFQFLGEDWKKNTEAERLLGVSLTGILDSKLLTNPTKELLEELRDHARTTNERLANDLGIPASASITCVN